MASVGLAVLLIHVVVASGFLAVHARSTRRSASRGRVAGATGPGPTAPAIPSGRQLEEYVQAGLVDLRIMLAQAARRGHA